MVSLSTIAFKAAASLILSQWSYFYLVQVTQVECLIMCPDTCERSVGASPSLAYFTYYMIYGKPNRTRSLRRSWRQSRGATHLQHHRGIRSIICPGYGCQADYQRKQQESRHHRRSTKSPLVSRQSHQACHHDKKRIEIKNISLYLWM